MKKLFAGISLGALALGYAGSGSAAIITYDVNLTFDPNATAISSLGAAGPGTVTGTLTINTSEPISSNLVAVDLTEKSNDGTVLSVFSQSASEVFDTVTPYTIIFLFSPTTIYPAVSSSAYSGTYELVSLSSPPIVDSIQEGPSITFDFPYTAGGSVIPGDFDSIASTGFNAYLFGTVEPVATPEPSTWAMMLIGFAGLGFAGYRGARKGSATTIAA